MNLYAQRLAQLKQLFICLLEVPMLVIQRQGQKLWCRNPGVVQLLASIDCVSPQRLGRSANERHRTFW